MNRKRNHKVLAQIVFIIMGVLSTLWFLVRVIPKPSRATYPCMRAAAPFMSGFVVYLLGLVGTVFSFRKVRENLCRARRSSVIFFIFAGILVALFSLGQDSPPVYANSTLLLGPNQPIGVAKGINPGRVVWVWDSSATNARCTNTFGDGWFQNNNTDTTVVNAMVADAVKKLTGRTTIVDSWDALFKYFNQNHGKGSVGYKDGEKIFIKTNQVSANAGTFDTSSFAIKNQSGYGMAETSPQVVLAILKQLVNEYSVRQENISIGDPMKHMYKHVYDLWHNNFPNITYIDYAGTHGRTKPVAGARPSIYYSDRGTVLKDNGTTGNPFTSDYLPTVMIDANYLIVVPAMKAHSRAGVSLCGKIHYGSNLVGSATHLHGGLIAPNNIVSKPDPLRRGYGSYRTQVDLMGHKDLGGKTVLFVVDALWAGSEANDPPRKFAMAPFNNDWTSTVFVSQDQVALESVCFDFLKTEFTSSNPYGSYPQIEGADDHILQAADSSYWPKGIQYDPENDGTTIGSLGVCEHWNNAVDKQYSRNLKTGNGIELVYINRTQPVTNVAVVAIPRLFTLFQNYPNPFNPTTTIQYEIPKASYVSLKIFNMLGQPVATLVDEEKHAGIYQVRWNANVPSGIYCYRIQAGAFTESEKMTVLK